MKNQYSDVSYFNLFKLKLADFDRFIYQVQPLI
jgi:hypothetical protein